jgi:hypothetical protein
MILQFYVLLINLFSQINQILIFAIDFEITFDILILQITIDI